MQYQVFKTDGELVAWLDTETKRRYFKNVAMKFKRVKTFV